MQNSRVRNGQEGVGTLQFINETETIINESLSNGQGSFIGNLKRSGLDAGLDTDSDSDDNRSDTSLQHPSGHMRKHGPKPGKKTKGRVKIKMEFIENKLRRYTTFSKRKTGIMKKAYELSTLTGTQVMLLVASETGHVYTFATRKLQPMITSESGKALIQTCLNSPDPLPASNHLDQRMNPTGFEETELSYAVSEEEAQKGDSPVPYFSAPATSSQNSSTPEPQNYIQQAPTTSTSLPVTQNQIAMATYVTSQPPAEGKTANISMQLPTGGITAILPPTGLPPGTPFTIGPIQQGQQQITGQQQTVYRLPAGAAGQVVSIPALSNQAASSSKATDLSQTSTAGNVAPQPIAVLAGAVPSSSATQGTLMYQTPQGLMYAAPSTGLSGVPEGYVLNLQQAPTLTLQQQDQQAGGATQQYITIPVPVSLANSPQMFQSIIAQNSAGDSIEVNRTPQRKPRK